MAATHARMAPVIESGRTLRAFFEVEREVVRTLSTIVPRVGELELKYCLCQQLWDAAQRARFLRERGRELGGFGTDESVRTEISRVFEEAIRDPDPMQCLAALSGVLMRGLRRSYLRYLESAEPLADWPTRNLLREFVADVDRNELELEPWLASLNGGAWVAHVQEAYTALGGWTGETERQPVARPFVWLSELSPYAHPALPNREPHSICATAFGDDPSEYPIVRSWLTDPDTDPAIIRAMVYVWLMNEADAVDYLSTIFYDTPTAPFDYHFDLARHVWDESRHSQFGYRQLPRIGIDVSSIEQQVVLYDVLVRMQPHERYVMVTWHFEAGSFDIKAAVMDRVRELGDFEADTLLAFDRSDEQNHVRFGYRWLPTLLELYGDDRDPKTFALETGQRFAQLEREATARIGHTIPPERRLTAERIRAQVSAVR